MGVVRSGELFYSRDEPILRSRRHSLLAEAYSFECCVEIQYHLVELLHDLDVVFQKFLCSWDAHELLFKFHLNRIPKVALNNFRSLHCFHLLLFILIQHLDDLQLGCLFACK